jgi:hypothetical protein
MSPRALGIGLLAVGVGCFFGGLFGLAGELSIHLAGGGLLLLVAGLLVLLFALRKTRVARPSISVVAVAALGAALHAYESFWLASGGPAVGFFLWAVVPYAMCLVVAMASKSAIPALAGAVVALAFDLLAHYEVFVHPTSSTAALALLFAPLWNTLVFSPIAILLTWLILRRRAQLHEAAP